MGRLFDTKETSTSTTTKGRLFTEPVAEQPSTLSKVGGFLAPTTTKTLGKLKKGEKVTGKDVLGSALEVGSYLIPGGVIAKGVGLGIKGAGMASKVANGVAMGALSGGMFNAGGTIAEGGSVGDIAKSTLKGAALAGTAGGVLGTLAGGLAARKLAQKTEAQFAEEALARANLGPIPEASNPRLSLPAPRTPNETPIQLPSEGILKGQQLLRETGPTIPTPKESVAIAKAKKESIVYSNEKPSLLPDTPEVIARKERAFEDLNNTQPAKTPFEVQTNKEQLNIAAQDSARLEDVVFNNAEPAKGSNRNAYLSYMKQLAEEQTRNGDSTLAKKIVNSGITKDVSGTLAQGLQASQLVGRDNIINILERFKNEMAEKLPTYTKNNSAKEVSVMKEEVKKLYSKLEDEPITPEDLGDIVKSIICK